MDPFASIQKAGTPSQLKPLPPLFLVGFML